MFRNDLAEPMICTKDDSNTCGERFDESYTTLARGGRTVYCMVVPIWACRARVWMLKISRSRSPSRKTSVGVNRKGLTELKTRGDDSDGKSRKC